LSKKSIITMSALTATSGKTYRFKFSKGFVENLKEFTRIHKFDDPKIFREHFDEWKEENNEIITREKNYMKNMGYEGDVISKMYKSARYYFKNKSDEKTKPKKRRQYIGIDVTLKDKMDIFIDEKMNAAAEECPKPADAYNEFIENENNKIILQTEKARLVSFGMEEDDVNKKFKKTFKNRYFLKMK
tara:strand:- start:2487 stop:3047 length:561 start_codon:yes stop_codon:yes gene_type:complete